jgi:hypothetical protein
MTETTTHGLGQGWYANMMRTDGAETMTIRNPDKGIRIDLPAESVALLRNILEGSERLIP